VSKTRSNPTIGDNVKAFLADGKIWTIHEIRDAVEGKEKSIDTAVRRLVKRGEIIRADTGEYRLSEVQDAPAATENSRGEAENTETINKMLNLYDKLLDTVADSIEKEDWNSITEKIEAIKSLRWLGATVDQLMKRWYLLYRGYDTNTRQAVEDAKKNTSEREKQDTENAPPEDRVVEVGHFHPDMQELWDILPEPEKKKRTV
jgi:hypothetical protein